MVTFSFRTVRSVTEHYLRVASILQTNGTAEKHIKRNGSIKKKSLALSEL